MTRLAAPSLTVAAVLAATLCWEVQSMLLSSPSATTAHPAASVVASAMPAPRPVEPVDAWATTALERPLLRESRRPDKTADPQRKGDDIPRLAGVVTGPFGDHAIFVMPGLAKPVVAIVGAQVSNFVVRSIEPGRVLVDAAGVLRTYKTASGAKSVRVAPDRQPL